MTSNKEFTQKCVYYQGRRKCAFWGQRECVYEKGMIPFPYACGVEARMEDDDK